jgi:hypothetical protein
VSIDVGSMPADEPERAPGPRTGRAAAWAGGRRPAGPAAAPASNATGPELLHVLRTACCAADPLAEVRKVVAAASASLHDDGRDEAAWYVLLRGHEMLREAGPVRAGAARYPSLREVARTVAERFPSSPRLATLRARVEGGVAVARAALAVNPVYAPAQVALARALLADGSPETARALLEAVEQPERIQGGAVALARARVETGEPGKALLAAAREPNAPGLHALEPAVFDVAVAREVDEVRGLARLALGAFEAGARSLLRAAGGSLRARRALAAQRARPEVRRALARLARDGSLSAEARALAGVLAR